MENTDFTLWLNFCSHIHTKSPNLSHKVDFQCLHNLRGIKLCWHVVAPTTEAACCRGVVNIRYDVSVAGSSKGINSKTMSLTLCNTNKCMCPADNKLPHRVSETTSSTWACQFEWSSTFLCCYRPDITLTKTQTDLCHRLSLASFNASTCHSSIHLTVWDTFAPVCLRVFDPVFPQHKRLNCLRVVSRSFPGDLVWVVCCWCTQLNNLCQTSAEGELWSHWDRLRR